MMRVASCPLFSEEGFLLAANVRSTCKREAELGDHRRRIARDECKEGNGTTTSAARALKQAGCRRGAALQRGGAAAFARSPSSLLLCLDSFKVHGNEIGRHPCEDYMELRIYAAERGGNAETADRTDRVSGLPFLSPRPSPSAPSSRSVVQLVDDLIF